MHPHKKTHALPLCEFINWTWDTLKLWTYQVNYCKTWDTLKLCRDLNKTLHTMIEAPLSRDETDTFLKQVSRPSRDGLQTTSLLDQTETSGLFMRRDRDVQKHVSRPRRSRPRRHPWSYDIKYWMHKVKLKKHMKLDSTLRKVINDEALVKFLDIHWLVQKFVVVENEKIWVGGYF